MKREVIYNEVYDSQRYYRLLLDSMARPGKINVLPAMEITPPPGIHKSGMLVAMTLLNADVTFHYVGENVRAVSEYILLNTSSSPASAEEANFIFMNGADDGNEILNAQIGTLAYPEDSATCVVDVKAIRYEGEVGDIQITLKGPGVKDHCVIYVAGLNEQVLQNLFEQNQEFPLGIDMILTDLNNNILCIPRSNQFTWKS